MSCKFYVDSSLKCQNGKDIGKGKISKIKNFGIFEISSSKTFRECAIQTKFFKSGNQLNFYETQNFFDNSNYFAERGRI